QPGLLIGAQHDTGLVVLGRKNTPYSHGHVEVTGKHFAVDVTAVADVAVTGLTPEICAWIDTHREHVTGSLPAGGLVKPLHEALHGVYGVNGIGICPRQSRPHGQGPANRSTVAGDPFPGGVPSTPGSWDRSTLDGRIHNNQDRRGVPVPCL